MGVPSDVYVTRARGRDFFREISRSLVRPSKLRARAVSHERPASLLHCRQMNPETVRVPPSAAGTMCSLERLLPVAEFPHRRQGLVLAAMFMFTKFLDGWLRL